MDGSLIVRRCTIYRWVRPTIRTDLTMTIFCQFQVPMYESGELLIQGSKGVTAYKPNNGDAVVYPCICIA